MEKRVVIISILVILILIVGCQNTTTQVAPEKKVVTEPVVKEEVKPVIAEQPETKTETKEHIIETTEEGFSPDQLAIKVGETVKFVNKRSRLSWPASAIHPTHQSYPGSDIKKCKTEESNKIFDACRGLKSDESYEFTFNEKGSWNFHDHLNPRLFGTITVE